MTRWRIGLPITCLALAGCQGQQSVLDVAGAPAIHIRQLIIGIVGVCSLVWAIVMVALIWALLRRRPTETPDSGTSERRMGMIVICATVATVAIIAGFTYASFRTTRALSDEAADITIAVRGQQWWWELTYIDADPSRSFKTANEIRIPVGRPVKLQLESIDVIHSLWVPSLAGKLDLIPGRTNEMMIRAEHAGVYRGQCAEFCGTQHTHMSIFVIALEPDQYAVWADAQRRDAEQPVQDEAAAGAKIFADRQCGGCHSIRGTTANGTLGPDLTHIADRTTIAAGLFETTRGSVAAWIADPQTLKPGNNMPIVPLTGGELRQLSAYMMSLR
jgi:cytochrome c oxidase subunit 2